MADIVVTVGSRFPRLSDYDEKAHKYGVKYIQAKGYDVQLSACRGLPRRKVTLPPAPPLNKAVSVEIPIVPNDVAAYRWTLTHQDGSRVTTRRPRVGLAVGVASIDTVPCTAEAELPKPGTYQVELAEELTGGGERTTRTTWTLRDELVVCLGDSFASGEGNPDVSGEPTLAGSLKCENATLSIKFGADVGMDRRPRWLEKLAHRSLQSGHALGVKRAERLQNAQLITFLTFATSGAETGKGLLEPQHDFQREFGGQIEEAATAIAGRRRASAVVMSIGGNNVGFSSGLRQLASDWLDGGSAKMIRDTRQRIKKLGPELDKVDEKIRRLLQPNAILLTEYPTAFFDGANGNSAAGCGAFSTLGLWAVSNVDAGNVKMLAEELNNEIRDSAFRNGWVFVDDISKGFARHGYCSGSHFFVQATESCRRQGDFDGIMHPNSDGHRVYAQRVAEHLSFVLNYR